MICFNVNRKNYRDLVQIYLPKDNCISLGYFKGPKNKKLWYLGINGTCYMIRKNLFWWSHVLQGWLYKHHIYPNCKKKTLCFSCEMNFYKNT